jgi:uncharacterized membrane protein (UPF0136 family)
MKKENNPSMRRAEMAFVFAIVIGLILGIFIKKIRVGMLIGVVIGVLILMTGWLRTTRK